MIVLFPYFIVKKLATYRIRHLIIDFRKLYNPIARNNEIGVFRCRKESSLALACIFVSKGTIDKSGT